MAGEQTPKIGPSPNPDRDPPARMPQVCPDRLSQEARAFLDQWNGGFFSSAERNPPLLTLAHHPRLAGLFSQFNIHLLRDSTVPIRQRQIAILRTAWVCEVAYMWSSHIALSLQLGIEPEAFEAIKSGGSAGYFTEFEGHILLATDQLIADRKIAEETWGQLARRWDNRQLLDFMFTVGTYAGLAGVMRSAGIERTPELIELARKYGSPEQP